MFKLPSALVLALLAVAFGRSIFPAGRAPAVARGVPKCYITSSVGYQKAVYAKCQKKVCRREMQCKTAYHAAGASEAGGGEAIDAAAKTYYGRGNNRFVRKTQGKARKKKKKKNYGWGNNQYMRKMRYKARKKHAPKPSCQYVDACYVKEYACAEKYDEGYHWEHEKNKYRYYYG